jgi:hypothetical protein
VGWSSPGLAGERHVENLRSNRAKVVDDQSSWGGNRACRGLGRDQRVNTAEPTKGQARRTEISDRRMGHSRRKANRCWMSARGEELKMGQHATLPPGAEDKCTVDAAVPRVGVGSRKAADHREAFPGL